MAATSHPQDAIPPTAHSSAAVPTASSDSAHSELAMSISDSQPTEAVLTPDVEPQLPQPPQSSSPPPSTVSDPQTAQMSSTVTAPPSNADDPVIAAEKMQTTEPDQADTAEEDSSISLSNFTSAVDKMDENIDDAFGAAADTLWSFASSFSGRVSAAVSEKPAMSGMPAIPDMGNLSISSLRENVSSKVGQLDSIGRDLSSHLSTLAPPTDIAASVKNVAQSVQRNAQAMEQAILAKANGLPGDASGPDSSKATDAEKNDTTGTGTVDSAARLAVVAGIDGIPSTDLSDERDISTGDDEAGNAKPSAVEKELARVGEMVGSSLGKTEKELARVGEMVGSSLEKTVGGLWTGLWGDNGGDGQTVIEPREAKVPQTRFEQKIFELRANPDTYCEPAGDIDAFEAWGDGFDLDKLADECIEILSTHEAIAQLYEKVVPNVIEEDIFWMRYFFARHLLEQEEERRKKLLERAEIAVVEENNDEGWGDDDWGDDQPSDSNKTDAPAGKEAAPAGEGDTEKGSNEEAGIDKKGEDDPSPSASGTKKGGKDVTKTDESKPGLAPTNAKTAVLKATAEAEDDDWGDDWE